MYRNQQIIHDTDYAMSKYDHCIIWLIEPFKQNRGWLQYTWYAEPLLCFTKLSRLNPKELTNHPHCGTPDISHQHTQKNTCFICITCHCFFSICSFCLRHFPFPLLCFLYVPFIPNHSIFPIFSLPRGSCRTRELKWFDDKVERNIRQ
jgi:hypothetical protein